MYNTPRRLCPPLAGVGGGCRRDIIIDLEMELFIKVTVFHAVNAKLGTENFTEMTVNASGGVNYLWYMVTFFIKNRRHAQNLPRTIGNAKTATFTTVFNNNNMTQPSSSGFCFIRFAYWVLCLFLHIIHSRLYTVFLVQGFQQDWLHSHYNRDILMTTGSLSADFIKSARTK